MAEEKRWYTGMFSTEDWWSLWIGLFFVAVGLLAAATQANWLSGWVISFEKWVNLSNALAPDTAGVASGLGALIVSYIVFTAATCVGAYFMGMDMKKYFVAWTIIYWLSAALFILSTNAYIQATSIEREGFGIDWSLSIGGAHYIVALLVGLLIGNLAPKSFREFMYHGARPEWYIKIAIVFLGCKLGMKVVDSAGYTFELLLVGACATIAAYLLFWPLVYTMCRKGFKLTREWAATLASGISICGVSASIATGGAIRARPIVPVMISSLIVVFALVELIILPPVLTYSPWFNEPMAAASSLGLTVKTDGADAAAGAITDQLMRTRAQEELGVEWEEGWITSASVMTKIWIDMFIGVWALVLAMLWLYYVEKRPDEKVQKMEVWWRFPKFVLGYFISWFAVGLLGLTVIGANAMDTGIHPFESSGRHLFFILTFTSIGLVTNFRKLKEENMGRLALAYGLGLLFIIIPLGWIIAWVFHNGMMPPTVG